jgi:hypothetical protein
MKNKKLDIYGAHRGGTTISKSVLSNPKMLANRNLFSVSVVDPKENRASRLAGLWQENGFETKSLNISCEEAIEKQNPDIISMAIDTISPMAEVLKKKPKHSQTQWQLLARSMGTDGPICGISGTIVSGDSKNEEASIKLIDKLGDFIHPQSSTNITVTNPLNQDILHITRKQISRFSAKRLAILDNENIDPQDLNAEGGILSYLWDGKIYPMVIQERSSQKLREIEQQALQMELPKGINGNGFVTAILGQGKMVDFFVVETARSRFVRFHMQLNEPAVVTD